MRKYLLAGLAVALLLGGALFALLRPWHCPVTHSTFAWIKEDMTRAEVETILGGPPGDYRTRPVDTEGFHFPTATLAGLTQMQEWQGDEGDIVLRFDDDGRVQSAFFAEAAPDTTGPVGLLRFRLNRVRTRLFP
jgi:hypothetical protein